MYSTVQCNKVYSTVQHCTLYSVQHSTVRCTVYSTVQHCTVYSIKKKKKISPPYNIFSSVPFPVSAAAQRMVMHTQPLLNKTQVCMSPRFTISKIRLHTTLPSAVLYVTEKSDEMWLETSYFCKTFKVATAESSLNSGGISSNFKIFLFPRRWSWWFADWDSMGPHLYSQSRYIPPFTF